MGQSRAEIQAIARLQGTLAQPDVRSTLQTMRTRTAPVQESIQNKQTEKQADSDWVDPERSLWRQIEDQIQYLDQLATEQETAILHLMAIVQQIEGLHELPERELEEGLLDPTASRSLLQWAVGKTGSLLKAIVTTLLEVGGAAGSLINAFGLTAQASAQAFRSAKQSRLLRQREARLKYQPPVLSREPVADWNPDQNRDEEPGIAPTVQEVLTLVSGMALLRIGCDRVVQLYPALWIVTILLMIVPAVFAVYRSTCSPQSGFLWGIRLTLILIGLLLGGRL